MLHQVKIEREGTEAPGAAARGSREPSILDYYRRDDPDLFAKCRAWSRRLFDAGVKCGTVAYPAVPPDEAILRLAVNARHTPEDLGRAVEVLGELAAEFGVAGKTPAEIRAIGDALPGEVLQ